MMIRGKQTSFVIKIKLENKQLKPKKHAMAITITRSRIISKSIKIQKVSKMPHLSAYQIALDTRSIRCTPICSYMIQII